MRPSLGPGDGLLALRCGRAERGQVRVFPDPTLPTRWLVKRVGNVRGVGRGATFEARSDNPTHRASSTRGSSAGYLRRGHTGWSGPSEGRSEATREIALRPGAKRPGKLP